MNHLKHLTQFKAHISPNSGDLDENITLPPVAFAQIVIPCQAFVERRKTFPTEAEKRSLLLLLNSLQQALQQNTESK